MVNVLFVTYTLEPAGAERMVYSLASKINNNKYTPIVCSIGRGGQLVKSFQDNGIKTILLNKKSGVDTYVLVRLVRICREEKVSIIHSHNFSANLWGRLAGIISRIPCLIATEHSLTSNKTFLQKKIDKFLSLFTNKIITVSDAVRRCHILEEGIPRRKIITIYNGVNLINFQGLKPPTDMKSELGLSEDTQIVGIVGSLTEPKGHQFLIEAAKKVTKSIQNVVFLIIGSGKLKEKLKGMVMNRGIHQNMLFLGFRPDRLDIINTFDVAVLSSLREGLPISLLEYMALKKACVVTNVGGMPEVIQDGVNGLVVPPAEPTLLAAKITELLQNNKLSSRLGAKAFEVIKERFTEDIMVKSTEAVYDMALRKRKRVW